MSDTPDKPSDDRSLYPDGPRVIRREGTSLAPGSPPGDVLFLHAGAYCDSFRAGLYQKRVRWLPKWVPFNYWCDTSERAIQQATEQLLARGESILLAEAGISLARRVMASGKAGLQ